MSDHDFQMNGPGIIGSDICTVCGKDREDHDPREWLIRKDGYFYRPNCQGYTTHKHEAGRYSEEKARAEAAVEPWHMKAIHESEWPDDHVSAAYKDKAARIVALEAEVSRLTALVDEAKAMARPLARIAEAEDFSGTPDGKSIIVNVNLCRAARAFAEKAGA